LSSPGLTGRPSNQHRESPCDASAY
jgi:hypothetical protein